MTTSLRKVVFERKNSFTQNKPTLTKLLLLPNKNNTEKQIFKSCRKRIFIKVVFFIFLVFFLHKDPIELSNFDILYLENYFQFCYDVERF